jgi:hypothetical protein
MSSPKNIQQKSTSSQVLIISIPSIPTNWAYYQKTPTKLQWTSALEGGYCYDMVPTLLIVLLDLGKGPISVTIAMGISIVMVVALATSLSASFGHSLG